LADKLAEPGLPKTCNVDGLVDRLVSADLRRIAIWPDRNGHPVNPGSDVTRILRRVGLELPVDGLVTSGWRLDDGGGGRAVVSL